MVDSDDEEEQVQPKMEEDSEEDFTPAPKKENEADFWGEHAGKESTLGRQL